MTEKKPPQVPNNFPLELDWTTDDPCERETPTVPVDSFSLYRKQAEELGQELTAAALLFEGKPLVAGLIDMKAMFEARERSGKSEAWRMFFAGISDQHPPTSITNRQQAIEEFLIFRQECKDWLAHYPLPTVRPSPKR